MDPMSPAVNAKLDESYAKIFYHHGVPFRVAESESMREILDTIHPARTNLPTAKGISYTQAQKGLIKG
jgi:hypothetical protein